MEQRIDLLDNLVLAATSKDLLENLVIEIHDYLSNLPSNQLGADFDLTEKLVHSLGFALALLCTDSSSCDKPFISLLRSVASLSRNDITSPFVVQNAIIVSYLLSSSSIQDKFIVSEELKLFVEIWIGLKAYHKQLVQLATPKFLEQFKRVTMHHISINCAGEVSETNGNSIGRDLIQILFGMVINLSPESSGLSQLSESGWHMELLNLLTHKDTVISSCALGILNAVVKDTIVREQVFCPPNLVSIGNLVIKLVQNETESRFFRKNMFEILWRSEKEGLFSLDNLQDLASKITPSTIKVKPMMELISFFSCTNLSKTHSLYSFEFDEGSLSQLIDLCKTSKSIDDKMDVISFFRAHSSYLLQDMESCVVKRNIFGNTWITILTNEWENALNGAPQILDFLDVTLKFLQDSLIQLTREMESVLIQLFSKSISTEYTVSILLLLDQIPRTLLDYQNEAFFRDILSKRIAMIAAECFQGSATCIEKLTKLLQSKKLPFIHWISDWNQIKKIELGSTAESSLSVPILEVTRQFQTILQLREEEHRQQMERLVIQYESLSTASKESQIPEPVTRQKVVPVTYSEKMIATIQEVKSQSKKLKMECAALAEQKEILEINVAHLQAEYQEEVESKKEMLLRIESLENQLSKNQDTISQLRTELQEKSILISELQAELDDQTEYQAMVAKLAASVKNRKKAGGMVRGSHAQKSIDDRKVPNPANQSMEEVEQEQVLSQVFY